MPRGQYDRSHLKAKRAATKATKAAATATVAAGIAVAKSAVPVKPEGYRPPAGYVDMAQLREHLASLTETRTKLCTTQVAHNDVLIAVLDAEITNIVRSMSIWREAMYPSAAPVVATPEPVKPLLRAPVPAPAPITAPLGSAPPAPLPFTPQTVQEVLKSAGQQAQ